MQIAIATFDRFTALDAIGPYDVLSRVPGNEVKFVSHDAGPVTSDTGMLQIVAEATFEDVPDPDVLIFPGGPGTRTLEKDERVHEWIRNAHGTSRYTVSVCTGALVLGAAGILDGLEATTAWPAVERLSEFGATPVGDRRVVEQGKVITTAGVTAGLDMAFILAARLTNEQVAQAIQLGIEYDPEPPFDSGTPQKADPQLIELVRAVLEQQEAEALAAAG